MKIVVDLTDRDSVLPAGATMPAGVTGQISFGRLARILKKSGEARANEKLTHLEIDSDRRMIVYRVEKIS